MKCVLKYYHCQFKVHKIKLELNTNLFNLSSDNYNAQNPARRKKISQSQKLNTPKIYSDQIIWIKHFYINNFSGSKIVYIKKFYSVNKDDHFEIEAK